MLATVSARARRHQALARAAEAGDESRVAQIAQLMSADPSLAEAATRVQVCAVLCQSVLCVVMILAISFVLLDLVVTCLFSGGIAISLSVSLSLSLSLPVSFLFLARIFLRKPGSGRRIVGRSRIARSLGRGAV